jgi:AraC-like DNA-binding protein
MNAMDIWSLLLSGSAASICLLLTVNWLRAARTADGRWQWLGLLGAAFSLTAAAYALVSSSLFAGLLGEAELLFLPFVVLTGVMFWLFACALFDDHFRWRLGHAAPVLLVAGLAFTVLTMPSDNSLRAPLAIAWQMSVGALMLHVMVLAIRDLGDDLVEPRRQFRLALAFLVGVTGLFISVAEVLLRGRDAPSPLELFQSIAILTLAILFGLWSTRPANALIAPPPRGAGDAGPSPTTMIDPLDTHLLEKLEALMAGDLHREAGLTIGVLADRLATPEHRLRKLINQGLGQRNFSTYVNRFRIDDAKRVLADPAAARTQILTIALDLGFGSIAPFNRAFKNITGLTPTAYRVQALAEIGQDSLGVPPKKTGGALQHRP